MLSGRPILLNAAVFRQNAQLRSGIATQPGGYRGSGTGVIGAKGRVDSEGRRGTVAEDEGPSILLFEPLVAEVEAAKAAMRSLTFIAGWLDGFKFDETNGA